MSDIKIKTIQPNQLTGIQCYKLKHLHKTDSWDFKVLFDFKTDTLLINENVPAEDAEKFMKVISYPGAYLNDDDCEVRSEVDYVYEKYGYSAYYVLVDAWSSRREKKMDQKAQRDAAGIAKRIKDFHMNDESCPAFPEYLVYHVGDIGGLCKAKTLYNKVGMRDMYRFYLGYMMGTGQIKLDELGG